MFKRSSKPSSNNFSQRGLGQLKTSTSRRAFDSSEPESPIIASWLEKFLVFSAISLFFLLSLRYFFIGPFQQFIKNWLSTAHPSWYLKLTLWLPGFPYYQQVGSEFLETIGYPALYLNLAGAVVAMGSSRHLGLDTTKHLRSPMARNALQGLTTLVSIIVCALMIYASAPILEQESSRAILGKLTTKLLVISLPISYGWMALRSAYLYGAHWDQTTKPQLLRIRAILRFFAVLLVLLVGFLYTLRLNLDREVFEAFISRNFKVSSIFILILLLPIVLDYIKFLFFDDKNAPYHLSLNVKKFLRFFVLLFSSEGHELRRQRLILLIKISLFVVVIGSSYWAFHKFHLENYLALFIIAAGLLLFLAGLPVFITLLGTCMALFLWCSDDKSILSVVDINTLKSKDFARVPPLIMIGYFFAASKTPSRLLRIYKAWVGFLPASQAIIAVLMCTFLTALTGGSGIALVAIGGILYHRLVEGNYDKNFSLGLITAGCSLGLLLPPSVPSLILFLFTGPRINTPSSSVSLSIENLQNGGLLPSFLLVGIVLLYVIYKGRHNRAANINPLPISYILIGVGTYYLLNPYSNKLNPVFFYSFLVLFTLLSSALMGLLWMIYRFGAPHVKLIFSHPYQSLKNAWYQRTTAAHELLRAVKEILSSLWSARWDMVLVILIYLAYKICNSQATIEFLSITLLLIVIIQLFAQKDIAFKDIPEYFLKSVVLSSAIIIVIVAGGAIEHYIVNKEIVEAAQSWLERHIDPQTHYWVGTHIAAKWIFLIFINGFLLLFGSIMEIFAAIIVLAPLIIPAAVQPALGIDPVHASIIFLINLELGLLLPPFGLNLLLSANRFRRPFTTLYKSIIPFFLVILAVIIVVNYGLETFYQKGIYNRPFLEQLTWLFKHWAHQLAQAYYYLKHLIFSK